MSEKKDFFFKIEAKDRKRIDEWSKIQDKLTMDLQNKRRIARGEKTVNYPYYGCSGGELQYIFIPTTIGIITKVKHAMTENEFDFTDYGNF
jgi:hypothetical protein